MKRRTRKGVRWRGVLKWLCVVASVLVLLLFAASFVWRIGAWWWTGPVGSERCHCVQLLRGGVRYTRLWFTDSAPTTEIAWRFERQWVPISIWWPSVMLTPPGGGGTAGRGADVPDVMVPLWLPLAVLGPAAAVLMVADRRSVRRRRAGQCAACGYDLAGLAPGVACPECGAGRVA